VTTANVDRTADSEGFATAALARLRLALPRRKIPLINQVSQVDCGVASLAMVLAYHGRHVRREELRDLVGIDRDGANAYAILAAARQHGLRARGLKIEVEDLVHLDPATILHWEFNHFLVFERIQGGWVYLVDPASGRRRVGLAQFRRAFTGIALVFEPSETFERTAARPKRIAHHLRDVLSGGQFARVLSLSLALQAFALVTPVITGAIVDSVVPRGDLHLLTALGLGLACTAVFHFIATMTRGALLLHLRTRLDAAMSMSFVEHLVSLPYVFFQRRSAGDLLMRLNSNSTIRELLTSGLLSTLLDGGTSILYFVGLIALSPSLAAMSLAFGVLEIAVFSASRSRRGELMADDLRIQAKSRAYEIEMLNGIETLKAMGVETSAVQHWSNLFVDTLNASLARGRLAAVVDSLLATLRLAAPVVVLVLGAVRVLDGELSVGSMLALDALAVGFLTPLATLVTTASQLQILGTFLERLDDVFDTDPEAGPEQRTGGPSLSGAIKLEDVSFGYGERSRLVVRDVSVTIEPGQFIAIVGPSGSGKSTLASLLVALYTPTRGRVLFDGRDLVSFNPREVRRQVGVVVQKPYLFASSVRANIALADEALPLDTVMEAAQAAGIHEEIMAMPMQYETLVSDGGSALSGGQRQRLALARALVHKPAIILLDEATSSLDAIAEARVQATLEKMHCTRIVIAHRLSTVQAADVILMLKDGSIVERGTHAELIARGGAYYELVNAQLGRPAAEE
jgi:ABC-type bacteriocin/lantibiotic exporter with double-glycine peptidase domain